MSILPDKAPPGVDGALYARAKEAALSLGAALDRMEAWRRSEGWEDVPAPARRGVLAVLEYAHALVTGMAAIGDHGNDPTRRQIEVSYMKRLHDHTWLLYDLGMDAWEDASGSREIPVFAARPRRQTPPPERTPEKSVPRGTAAGVDTGAGLVYLLRSDQGHHKIGHTRDLKHRRAAFGVTLPFGFEILHTIPSDNRLAAEQQLHARFADRRNNGEWFDLTDEDVAYIKSLTEL